MLGISTGLNHNNHKQETLTMANLWFWMVLACSSYSDKSIFELRFISAKWKLYPASSATKRLIGKFHQCSEHLSHLFLKIQIFPSQMTGREFMKNMKNENGAKQKSARITDQQKKDFLPIFQNKHGYNILKPAKYRTFTIQIPGVELSSIPDSWNAELKQKQGSKAWE